MLRAGTTLVSCLTMLLVACGTSESLDTDSGGADDAGRDAAFVFDAVVVADTPSSAPDAAENDADLDASVGLDASSSDVSDLDAGGTGELDAGDLDAGSGDAGATDTGPFDAGAVLPTSCTTSAECGPSATCVSSRCVCNASSLPCGTTCCPWTYARDVRLAAAGHSPEIGFDAAGNVFVLFKLGNTGVRLASLLAGGIFATSGAVTTSSGLQDDTDLAVAPDGTVMIAVHQPGVGRSGSFTLLTRAPGATSFTPTSLRPTPPPAFAFDAAVSISRAPSGDMYAGVSARVGDGTAGLAMTRYDAALGTWASLTTIRSGSAYSRSELFARSDGFFVGMHDFPNDQYFYEDFTSGATSIAFLSIATTVMSHGESAAAMTDGDVLHSFSGRFSSGAMESSDGVVDELVTFAGPAAGNRSDIDMAFDADDNPALVVHSATNRAISLMVRMPTGGYTRYSWFDSAFLPLGTTSTWMTLDAERLPNGNIAIVIGDSLDRGELRYLEIAR